MTPELSCDQPSAPRILLRQLNKHQSCGCLPAPQGSRQQDLDALRRAVEAAMGEQARISHPAGPRYPDPHAAFEFVIDVPPSLRLEQAARDLAFALLSDPLCAGVLAQRGELIAQTEPDPRARRLRSRLG